MTLTTLALAVYTGIRKAALSMRAGRHMFQKAIISFMNILLEINEMSTAEPEEVCRANKIADLVVI